MVQRIQDDTGQFRGECYGAQDVPVTKVKQHGKCPKKYDHNYYVRKCICMIKSVGWLGASSQVTPPSTPSTPQKWCNYHGPRDSFSSDRATAVQWTRGFEPGASLGSRASMPK